MLCVSACIWDANKHTKDHCGTYDETWVDKLYRGFARNLTVPFRFVLFTDKQRTFSEPIEQMRLATETPNYGCYIEPFKLNKPTILVGLDTIILGNIDHYADYCMRGEKLGLCRDPYKPDRSINGVALIPTGHRNIYDFWRGENDMEWLRQFPWQPLDDIFAGEIASFKFAQVAKRGTGRAKVIYFHGQPKPPTLMHLPWVRQHWA